MPESILTNPLWSGKAYRVAAPSGNGAMTLICYNLNVSPRHQQVQAIIKKEDYSLRNSFEKMSATSEERVLLYNWESQKAEELSDSSTFELIGFTDKLFHLCPIRKGWAAIGVQEKYLSPSTVQTISLTENRLVLNVLCTGTLKVWIENSGKQELRSISIDTPQKIVIEK